MHGKNETKKYKVFDEDYAEHPDNLFPIFLIWVGMILVGVATVIFLFTFFPVIKEEVKYHFINNDAEVVIEKDPAVSLDENKVIMKPVDTDFSVVIPKIRANAKVIKDVDPYDSYVYQMALTQGVAHAKGTTTPDEEGNVFLFAHSSDNFYNANRYNSVFYLLHRVEEGDNFYIIYEGKIYKYWITEKSIVEAGDVDYFSGGSRAYDKPQTATLMTCWPPGTTLKRLVLVGELVEVRY